MTDTVHIAKQAFWIDAAHGGTQEHYGEQLRRWRHAFAAMGGEPAASGVTLDPLHFALAAWEVATRPVAESPYVRTHPRVLDATCHRAEDSRDPLAVVELAAPPPVPLPDGWSSWRHLDEQPYAPGPDGTPTALSTVELRIPLTGERLPTPTRPRADGLPNLDDAQASLEAFVAELNAAVTPFLRELDVADGTLETDGATLVEWLRTQIEADKATAEAAGAGAWRLRHDAGAQPGVRRATGRHRRRLPRGRPAQTGRGDPHRPARPRRRDRPLRRGAGAAERARAGHVRRRKGGLPAVRRRARRDPVPDAAPPRLRLPPAPRLAPRVEPGPVKPGEAR
ncbi:MAG: hypothetical protein HOW59_21265 [Nonomuraea sp.]|nr:hypothetical protein [Nonomuraea sp.]